MTDQDHDGSHIKGLIINFLHHTWPQLIQKHNFVTEFITPIVKTTKKGSEEITFYTLPQYREWRQKNNDGKGWTVKYYKGLGTSSPAEAKTYFSAIRSNQIAFRYSGTQDDHAIELAFGKDKKDADRRKEWMLSTYHPDLFVDHTQPELTYTDFINKELIQFSMADAIRSIPSAVDGLKPGQRKILYACFKRKLVNEIKVAQLSGYVAEHSAYHHGEQSLASTIVNMAQNFVGSNNVSLLMPNGQFGTRLQGGKDAASSRYIFTCLSRLTRMLFPLQDDPLLNYLDDDGTSIEPQWYIPILPMVLVNGAEGIGTGWSTSVPCYNPRDIVANMVLLLQQKEMVPMVPWYKNFKGRIVSQVNQTIQNNKQEKFSVEGCIEKLDSNTVMITELPIGKWTQDYKEILEKFMLKQQQQQQQPENTSLTSSSSSKVANQKSSKIAKQEIVIESYKEHHTECSVKFEVRLSEAMMAIAEAEGLLKSFKLVSKITTSNMHLFDQSGQIHK